MGNNDVILQVIASELAALRSEVSELRAKDIPLLQTNMAVVQDRSSRSAKLISGVSSLLTLALSLLIAWLRA